MTWTQGDVWVAEVMLPAGQRIEYKYVILEEQVGQRPRGGTRAHPGDDAACNVAGLASLGASGARQAARMCVPIPPAPDRLSLPPPGLDQAGE